MRHYRTPAQKELTWRRGERTRRATSIKGTIRFCQGLADAALPFWRDQILYEDVRNLVHLVRGWGWVEPMPPALSLVIVDPPTARSKGDDDGVEYGDPRDRREGR